MAFEVLKPFAFSVDGVNAQHAEPGDDPDLPEGLIAGLTAEGFVKAAPATFDQGGLTKPEIMADLDRLGITYDARLGLAKLDALLREGKSAREAAVNASVEAG